MSKKIVFMLERIGAPELSKCIKSLFEQLYAKGNKTLLMAVSSYADIIQLFLKAISENGKVSDKLYKQLRKLQNEVQSSIEDSLNIESPLSAEERQIQEVLHLMGGISNIDGNNAFSFFIFPEMLLLSFRLLSLLDSESRKKHINQISKLRNVNNEISRKRLNEIDSDVLNPVAKLFQSRLKEIVGQDTERLITQAQLELVKVEYLPTASDFYESAISYYQNTKWKNQVYYKFATTSGIILPEDRYGCDFFKNILKIPSLYKSSLKHPIRARYFDALISNTNNNCFYFFEWSRTAKAFQKSIEMIHEHALTYNLSPDKAVSEYLSYSKKNIIKFLSKKNIGFIGINSLPRIYNYLTLGNGRAVLVSSRDTNHQNQIAHGFMLHPTHGLIKYINDSFVNGKIFEDPIAKVNDYILDILGAPLIKGFIPPITGALRFATLEQRRERVFDMILNLKDSIISGNTTCNIISLPNSRTLNKSLIAERIIEDLVNAKI